MTKFEIEEKIVAMLKTVFDPEIPELRHRLRNSPHYYTLLLLMTCIRQRL